MLDRGTRIHLVGIGGIGLSAIARVLHGWGYAVSGSDREATALTNALAAEGITVYAGHRAEQVAGADLVIISSAVPADNPETVEAKRKGVPVVKREQFLGELTASKTTIAVAGTHGKTTTSAMIAWILVEAGLDPTFVVGGVLQNLGTNARAGRGPHFVIEADEYDRTFLGLQPDVAVVTILEHDHPDSYPTFQEMRVAFASFARQVVPGGLLVVCGDDEEALHLSGLVGPERRVETYGLEQTWNWRAQGVQLGNSAGFEVWHGSKRLGTCALQVPGQHNVLNALAALAASSGVGIDFGTAAAALTRYRGTERRFQVKGQAGGVTVVDDYAHHPTEIRVTLAAARLKYPGRRLWAIFQPHTYSRTAALLEDFMQAFDQADEVIVTGIYAAREHEVESISGADLVAGMEHASARYIEDLANAADRLAGQVQPGDIVVTLGAGDVHLVGQWLLEKLRAKEAVQ
ncbi:MAG: UDP-N-acetylmuramate--L-alanine ligase [Anaerolineae bacterium]